MDKRSKEDITLSMTMRKTTNKTSQNITNLQHSIREIKKNTSSVVAETKQSSARYQTATSN